MRRLDFVFKCFGLPIVVDIICVEGSARVFRIAEEVVEDDLVEGLTLYVVCVLYISTLDLVVLLDPFETR